MLLYLLRHGETAWNAERRIQGVSDTPLNEVGRAQAEALVTALKDRPIEFVATSPLRRARETAEILAEALSVSIEEVPGLSELDQGELEGKKIEELQEGYNGFFDLWERTPAAVRMPGGETLGELQERAWAAMEELRERHAGRTFAAVSHNLAISTILCRILGMDLNQIRRLRQHNASLNIVEHSGKRGWSAVTVNSLAHLREVARTGQNPYL
ncbi:MAG: histidine phosphatase family protein [bacterium]|nr:histidine phosphatase family protein [bacterium]